LKALGGKSFETWLRKNPNDFIVADMYEERAEDIYSSLAKRVPGDSADVQSTIWSLCRVERALFFRSRWEERFKLLRQKGINFGHRLRTSQEQ
jgi:hypothetical protein